MANEREEAYAALADTKAGLESWLAAHDWPVDPEVSRMLDQLLVMQEQKGAHGHI